LTLVVGRRPFVTLMRMPGNDVELAVGYLISAGIVRSRSEITRAKYVKAEQEKVVIGLAEAARRRLERQRTAGTEYRPRARPFAAGRPRVAPAEIAALGRHLKERQRIFAATGGTHAAAVAELPLDSGSIARAVVMEDVGRHNAMDKALGAAVNEGRNLGRAFLFMSSRLAYELVVKASRAGVSYMAGVSAPSDLAVELARRLRMLLVGFVRGDAMTIYSGHEFLDT